MSFPFLVAVLPENPVQELLVFFASAEAVPYTHKMVPPRPAHRQPVPSAPSLLILITYGIQADFDSLHLIDFFPGLQKEEGKGCVLTGLDFCPCSLSGCQLQLVFLLHLPRECSVLLV